MHNLVHSQGADRWIGTYETGVIQPEIVGALQLTTAKTNKDFNGHTNHHRILCCLSLDLL